MTAIDEFGVAAVLASRRRRIRLRSWPIAGAAGLILIGLMLAAGLALLSWLWAQAPAAVDAGKRLGGEVAAQVERAAPTLIERLEAWAPGLRERLQPWLPGQAALPAGDVSGTDIGPVPRYPGLVRTYFARDAQAVEVGYAGTAAIGAVIAHYVTGFTAAGYAQEVVAATPEAERHRFRREREIFELTLTRRAGRVVDVRLRQSVRS